MKRFETTIQYVKYKVLREIAKQQWKGELLETVLDIPKKVVSGKSPALRCCVYKERAIVLERVKSAMGGIMSGDDPIEVIEIACDACPSAGYEVTASCRGCIAHRCAETCKFGAIVVDHHRAHIDKSKCVECGQCAKVCPYSAIVNHKRPCQNACNVNAISINKNNVVTIDNSKCIACGACIYQCPFGAIVDKSQILKAVDLLRCSQQDEHIQVYAVLAPAIADQTIYSDYNALKTALKQLGFADVIEVSVGADMVAEQEAEELRKKGFLMSSCCPSFVSYVKKEFPELTKYLSEALSPMAMIGRHIKELHENAKVVFIGPCTAKKKELYEESVCSHVDAVLTFEEMRALLGSRDIELEVAVSTASSQKNYSGTQYARSGGMSETICKKLEENTENSFDFQPQVCNGFEECKRALLMKKKGVLKANYIEGMVCKGGCVGGAGCLVHVYNV